jgi:hypothetical protein
VRLPTGSARDPYLRFLAVLGSGVVAGFVVLLVTAVGLGGRPVVDQVSFVASGGLAGIAMVGFGLGLLTVQVRRRDEAEEAAMVERLTAAVAARVREARR